MVNRKYLTKLHTIKETTPNIKGILDLTHMKVNLTHAQFDLVNSKQIDKKKKFTLIFCCSKVQKASHY